MARYWFITGCLIAGLGVAAGAFGAHALKQRLSTELLQVFETGVRYQMYHAFGAAPWLLWQWIDGPTIPSNRRVVILGWNRHYFPEACMPSVSAAFGPWEPSRRSEASVFWADGHFWL